MSSWHPRKVDTNTLGLNSRTELQIAQKFSPLAYQQCLESIPFHGIEIDVGSKPMCLHVHADADEEEMESPYKGVPLPCCQGKSYTTELAHPVPPWLSQSCQGVCIAFSLYHQVGQVVPAPCRFWVFAFLARVLSLLSLLLHAFPAKRQGASCRQAAAKGCHNPTPCWTRQIQARPNQTWARCSVFIPDPTSQGHITGCIPQYSCKCPCRFGEGSSGVWAAATQRQTAGDRSSQLDTRGASGCRRLWPSVPGTQQ